MSDRALRLLALASTATLVAGLAGAVAFGLAADDGARDIIFQVTAISFWGGVGAALAILRPRNAVGWLLLAIGVTLSVSGAGAVYVEWSKTRGDELPAAAWGAWFGSSAWIVVITFLIPRFLLVFPDGRPPSRGWRVVAIAQYVVLLALAVGALEPGSLPDRDYERYDNPVGIGALDWLNRIPAWTSLIGLPVLVIATVGAAASLIVRFRRSRGAERQQMTLVAWVVGITAVTWIGANLIPNGVVHDAVQLIAVIGLVLAPVAVLVAVLRYRLYDIDAVISKTIVYGVLTVILGLAYVGLVLAGQAISSSVAGGSNLAIAASTLVVAALFLPVRARVQRFVDRRFYRRRYDAQRTLEGFGARLRKQVDVEDPAGELRVAAIETMQPASVSLWRAGGTP